MIALRFEFPSGRYHATPWGRHVNEGAIEWPPSPWRLLRALLAQGFNRLGWTEVPPTGRALLEKLGGALPRYAFAEVSTGHTRHYMPTDDKPTKVIDTFAWVGREGEALFCIWEDVSLEEPEAQLLDQLVSGMPYLGRAESWVRGSIVNVVPAGLLEARAAEASVKDHERVPLLAPVPAPEYAQWRSAELARERDRLAEKKGGKASRKDQERLEALYPANLIEVLRADTRVLQEQGWSQPPGTRWISYWRPDRAFDGRPAARRIRGARKDVQVALLALTSQTANAELLPRVEDTIRRMHLVHQSLVRLSDPGDGTGPSPCFTAKLANGERLRGHQHAYLLPESVRDPRFIDHLLVYCPMGFDRAALDALHRIDRTWAKDRPTLYLTLVGMGAAGDFPSLRGARRSRSWRSNTAFVPPRHLKLRGKASLRGQVEAELADRRLPMPGRVQLELEDGSWHEVTETFDLAEVRLARRWRRFRRERESEHGRPLVEVGLGLRLEFEEPVQGPVALGFGCHFGLGMFVPEEKGLGAKSWSPSGSAASGGP